MEKKKREEYLINLRMTDWGRSLRDIRVLRISRRCTSYQWHKQIDKNRSQ